MANDEPREDVKALRDQVRDLRDRVEIADLFARYARALDTKDWAALGDVFADEVTSNFLNGTVPKSEVVDFIRAFIDPLFRTHHHLGNLCIDINEDKATTSVHVRAYHAGAGDLRHLYEESLATFDAQVVRTPQGWRFSGFDEQIYIMLGKLEVFGFPLEASKQILVDGGHPAVDDPAFGERGARSVPVGGRGGP